MDSRAGAVHYHLNDDGSITRYHSGSDFYFHHQHGSLPSHGLTEDQRIPADQIGRVEDQVTALTDLDQRVHAALKN